MLKPVSIVPLIGLLLLAPFASAGEIIDSLFELACVPEGEAVDDRTAVVVK